jgi:coenzyme F420-reducing hydrogenase gamma subunit
LPELPVILVVEDEELLQSIVEETLSDGGFEPVFATSGEEAVSLLKSHNGRYRALVTDIQSEGQDGRLGGCPARQRNRSRVSNRLYERGRRRRLDLQRRTEEHHVSKAVCASPTSHRCLQPSQRRNASAVGYGCSLCVIPCPQRGPNADVRHSARNSA